MIFKYFDFLNYVKLIILLGLIYLRSELYKYTNCKKDDLILLWMTISI